MQAARVASTVCRATSRRFPNKNQAGRAGCFAARSCSLGWNGDKTMKVTDLLKTLTDACKSAEADLSEAIDRLPARFCDREDYKQCIQLRDKLRDAIDLSEKQGATQ
jgi:hypothetical protein